jgi:hypothetical protein
MLLTDLPFVTQKSDGTIDYWNIEAIPDEGRPDVYSVNCRKGRHAARELRFYMQCGGSQVMFACIMQAMILKGRSSSVEISFLTSLGEFVAQS